jgi:cobalt-zinc-cadmium efflux system membrane fusion protein
MKLFISIRSLLLIVILAISTAYSFAEEGHGGHDDHEEHGSDHHDEDEPESGKGPHNGRLLEDGDFQVELAIFEQGVPPEYRAWALVDGKPVSPKDWQLSVELTRLGGQVDHFQFSSEQDYLRGNAEVTEPHSFDVSVTATYKNRKHHWKYESYEGRIQLNADLAEQSGIVTAQANAGELAQTLRFYGQISHDPTAIRQISARYPGIVQQVNVHVGSKVKAGDVLAVVEANDSLRPYKLTAAMEGVVITRNANVGEAVAENPLFTLADPHKLQLSFPVFTKEVANVSVGQPIHLTSSNGTAFTSSLESLTAANDGTPALIARGSLVNPQDGIWIPGSRVALDVAVARIPVALRVDNRALQSFRDWQVVFIKVEDTYEIRPLTLGRTDGQFTEVLGGLNPGDHYVVENSYLLKADLEKSGASHDH